MTDDDISAWRGVLADDEAALGALFERHRIRLFAHASRLLTDREDAKDAVTIAFFELWRHRRRVRLVDGSPLPWLLVTVAHSARNLERSRRRYGALVARIPASRPAPEVVSSDESGVLAALKRLPLAEQHVVVLSILEGYAERETAEILGIPPGTVKSRLSRAKAKLRGDLAAKETTWA